METDLKYVDKNWLEFTAKRVRRVAYEIGISATDAVCCAVPYKADPHYNFVQVTLGGETRFTFCAHKQLDQEEAELYAKALETDLRNPHSPVSYYGHGLWRCRDGRLSKENGAIYDIGPLDLYLRIPIPTGLKDSQIVATFGEHEGAQARGEKLLNSDRIATLADTNLPPKGHVWEEEPDLLGVSWSMQVHPACVVEAQHFLDKTVFAFYAGGEKPFYQCNMAAMAQWESHAVRGNCTFPEPYSLRRPEKCWIGLTLETAPYASFDLFVKLVFRRYRGVC